MVHHRLPTTLTIAEAKAAVEALEGDLDAGEGPFEIDASALQNFDTSAIAVLLEGRRQAQALGRGIVVRDAPATMVELAGLYGVAALLGLEARAGAASGPTAA
ncbi:MAG TPA: STAS domain-containing protein [Burkholderiaceae bacterium]|nr:STAS domain-containing protein [Burkholderiaceae bacterium]